MSRNPSNFPVATWFTLSTSRLMVAILFVLLFVIAARIPVDSDTWWHLRSGKAILETHSIPFADAFSFTKAGQPWIDQSWLAQIVLYGCYTILGGSIGLALFTAFLATVGMGFVFATCRGSVYLRGFVAILSAATAAVFWSARPQMFSFVLSAITLYLIYRHKRNPSQRQLLWLLPPLMVLWVNLHSGFAIGFIFLGCAVVGEFFNMLASGQLDKTDTSNPAGTRIGPLLIVSVICVFALVVNPYTTQIILYPFQTAGIGALQQSIQEWASRSPYYLATAAEVDQRLNGEHYAIQHETNNANGEHGHHQAT